VVPIQHQGTIRCRQKQIPYSHDDFQPSTEQEREEEESILTSGRFGFTSDDHRFPNDIRISRAQYLWAYESRERGKPYLETLSRRPPFVSGLLLLERIRVRHRDGQFREVLSRSSRRFAHDVRTSSIKLALGVIVPANVWFLRYSYCLIAQWNESAERYGRPSRIISVLRSEYNSMFGFTSIFPSVR